MSEPEEIDDYFKFVENIDTEEKAAKWIRANLRAPSVLVKCFFWLLRRLREAREKLKDHEQRIRALEP